VSHGCGRFPCLSLGFHMLTVCCCCFCSKQLLQKQACCLPQRLDEVWRANSKLQLPQLQLGTCGRYFYMYGVKLLSSDSGCADLCMLLPRCSWLHLVATRVVFSRAAATRLQDMFLSSVLC
jgi:hypothetical protein